jgi:hypothetical protein
MGKGMADEEPQSVEGVMTAASLCRAKLCLGRKHENDDRRQVETNHKRRRRKNAHTRHAFAVQIFDMTWKG